jgi:hypothetical protein
MPRNESEAIQLAGIAAIQRTVRFSPHARERMEERAAPLEDVLEAMSTCTAAKREPPRDKWLLSGGKDLSGDGLDVVVDWTDGEARVVTVLAPRS